MNAKLYSFNSILLLNQTAIRIKSWQILGPQEFRDSTGDETNLRANEPPPTYAQTFITFNQKYGKALFTEYSGSIRERGIQQT